MIYLILPLNVKKLNNNSLSRIRLRYNIRITIWRVREAGNVFEKNKQGGGAPIRDSRVPIFTDNWNCHSLKLETKFILKKPSKVGKRLECRLKEKQVSRHLALNIFLTNLQFHERRNFKGEMRCCKGYIHFCEVIIYWN